MPLCTTTAFAPPSAPGTGYVLLHHCFGEVNGKSGVWGHAVGGMGAITQAMARSATAAGAEIRTSAAVLEVVVEDGRAAGLVLAGGETIRARVVAANVPGLRDSVQDGQTGRLVPHGDPQALAREVGQLLLDPAERARLVTNALSWSERFDWDVSARRCLDILRRCCRKEAK